MSKTEWTDNLTFLSSLCVLERMAEAGKLTEDEVKRARNELERRLRPTIILL